MRKSRVELQAYRLLLECGVTEAPVPLEQIAHHIGATILYEPFDGDLSGMVLKKKGRIVIGINSTHHPNRQRFSIAHEIGHVVLHKSDQVHIDKQFLVKMRDDISSQAIDPEEIEANTFAAALLMPEAMLKNDLADSEMDCENELGIKELAGKYGVSRKAMTFRLTNLELVNRV